MTDEAEDVFDLGAELLAGMKEAVAHRRGEIALPGRRVGAMAPQRVREIRKAVSTSTRDFESRFGVSARTIEGWEHGKRVDTPSAVLLNVIEKFPGFVVAARSREKLTDADLSELNALLEAKWGVSAAAPVDRREEQVDVGIDDSAQARSPRRRETA